MLRITRRQRQNRYRKAIHYCKSFGYCILIEKESQSGNIKSIMVSRRDKDQPKVSIRLQPRKYRPMELSDIIQNHLPLL